ncbi:MAG TPA: restriction endonuclease [Pyrinomonadaceae bacterium]
MIDKCIHVAKSQASKGVKVTLPASGKSFILCDECAYIWNNDRRPNPLESHGYNIYKSSDLDLPKDQWTKVNDKPIPPTPDGKVQFKVSKVPEGGHFYIKTINAIGFDSFPSKVVSVPGQNSPKPIIKSLLLFGETTDDGKIVEAITLPWLEILELLQKDPKAAFKIPADKWEEIIAGAYHKAGFDQVTLTPRSGDYGRDVIALKKGIGTIRVIDQVKAYKPGHLVDANDVRALVGVLHGDGASKGFLTTTSDFAPKLPSDPLITPFMPSRLELINGEKLLKRLFELRLK